MLRISSKRRIRAATVGYFFFQAEDGIRDKLVTGVQTCALPIFTAGVTGDLMRVELGVGCDSGALIVEIVNLWPGRPVPGTAVRSRITIPARSEERRVGKECRARWSPDHPKKRQRVKARHERCVA